MEQSSGLNKINLTAKEASELADTYIARTIPSKMEEIFAHIKATALEGNFYITVGPKQDLQTRHGPIDVALNPVLVDRKALESLGFKVAFETAHVEQYFSTMVMEYMVISWGE